MTLGCEGPSREVSRGMRSASTWRPIFKSAALTTRATACFLDFLDRFGPGLISPAPAKGGFGKFADFSIRARMGDAPGNVVARNWR